MRDDIAATSGARRVSRASAALVVELPPIAETISDQRQDLSKYFSSLLLAQSLRLVCERGRSATGALSLGRGDA